jgi:arginase family enzyme
MHISRHADQRMNQRGISRRLVDFALRHGRVEGDKHVLDRNESRRLIDALEEELRLAKRVLDKGGVTVVAGGDTLVTAYNLSAARPSGGRRRY